MDSWNDHVGDGGTIAKMAMRMQTSAVLLSATLFATACHQAAPVGPTKPFAAVQKELPCGDGADYDALIYHILKRTRHLNEIVQKYQRDPEMDLMIQEILDSEAAIELHNKRHPNSPMKGSSANLLAYFCGNCSKERAQRAALPSQHGTCCQ